LTIREAIVKVLQASSQGMTVQDIFNKIDKLGLYYFTAKNPKSVINIELNRACKGSKYTNRAPKDIFKFEKTNEGEKRYSLLLPIWNDTIEKHFKVWLESENYALSTIKNYCSTT